MDAPNIYHYLPATGEISGMGFADPSPRDVGQWLVPANATLIAPGDVSAGNVAVFIDGAWGQLPDHRGETWWKEGQAYTITGLGDPSTDGFSPDGPPAAEPGYAVIWKDGVWVSLPDHRGEIWWAGYNQPVTIDFLGDPASRDLVAENPAPSGPEPEPEPEPVDPLSRPLDRIQFEFMIEKMGIGPAIDAAIEAMPADTEGQANVKLLAKVLKRSGQQFVRSNPLFTQLAPAVGMTEQQIDAAWLEALALQW